MAGCYADVYSVAPAGVFVPADSPVPSRRISPACHFGRLSVRQPLRHHPGAGAVLGRTDQTLVQRGHVVPPHGQGCWTARHRQSTLFSGPYYFAEQLGFRKIIDTTFMIATMITGDPDRRMCAGSSAPCAAPSAISICAGLYTHYYKREFPVRYLREDGYAPLGYRANASCLSRIPRKRSTRPSSWIADHGIFADTGMGVGPL